MLRNETGTHTLARVLRCIAVKAEEDARLASVVVPAAAVSSTVRRRAAVRRAA